jgi:hypothetical protein
MKRADGTGRRRVRPGFTALSAALAGLLLALTAGCGAPAAPQPPTLNLPQPVSVLAAVRSGNTVRISFSILPKTTDKLPVRGEVTAKLCRSVAAAPCQPVGGVTVRPADASAISLTLQDALPAELASGPPQLIGYRVTLENSGGKAAPGATIAYALAGQAPAPVAGFTATPRRDGIVLAWQRSTAEQNTPPNPAASIYLRVARTRTAGPSAAASRAARGPLAGVGGAEDAEPAEQMLKVPEPPAAGTPAAALDATARTGRSYRYTAQRIAQTTLNGHALEVASEPTAPALVDYRDVFPPPAPTGLLSAVDTPGHAIDLTWSPVQDPNLRGYLVYRRDRGASGEPQRLTPAANPVTVTAWSDTTALPGHRYAYSVSAVDPAGNESPRSVEVEETLPLADAQP